MPFSVGKMLERAIARCRFVRLVRGVAAVGVVWILGVAAVMAVDARFVIFDDRVRWAMTAGVWLLALATALFAVVMPLCRRLDFRRMSRALDARHSENEECLSTMVELTESDAAKAGFSASLFALVCNLSEDAAARVDVRREFPLRPALKRLSAFLLLVVVLGAGVAFSPNLVGRLFLRAVAPWADVGNLYANDVKVKPGDVVALSGTVVRIEAVADESLHAEPAIRISRRRGLGWSEETSEPMAGGVYETTADLGEREWRYRVNAGPAVTRYYHVRVSERPRYDSFLARIEYPGYTGIPAAVVSNADVAAIRAIAGTRVKFELSVPDGTFADFRIGGEPVFEHLMVSNGVSNWSLELVNRDGFRTSIGRHSLESFEDQPPTIVVEKPASKLPRLPPYAKIPFEITASDDVRVLNPVLRCSVDGAEPQILREVGYFAGVSGRLCRGKTEVDLSTIDLATAKNARFDFVVRDNCPPEFGGPHVVTSSVVSADLAFSEWGLEVNDLQQQVKIANSLIDEALRRIRDASGFVGELENELKRDGKVSEATEKKNEAAAHEIDETRKRLLDLRDRFNSDERFTPLAKPVEKTLEEKIMPALEGVESSPFRERGERAKTMKDAAAELRAAAEEVKDLSARLKDRVAKVEAFEKAKDLAARQEALSRAAAEITAERPVDTAKLEAWRRLQESAMHRGEELARNRGDAEFFEARRKMETAARRMADLKRDIDLDAAKNLSTKQKAEQRAQRGRAETARREQELKNAAADQKRAEQLQSAGKAAETAAAQRSAEDRLERGDAVEAVKALQHLAGEAERAARKSPQTREKSEAAAAAQREATAALRRELDIREAMRKGEKTEADLAALDRELKTGLRERAAANARAAETAARKTAAAAREAVGSAETGEISRLASAALAAKRDEMAAKNLESRLGDAAAAAEAYRAAAEMMDAVETAAAEEVQREKKILALQQSALEALQRADWNRALSLQREIAKEQSRAAEAAADDGGDSEASREEASRAQQAAAEAAAAASRSGKAAQPEAVKTQREAMESERLAQDEAEYARAAGKLAAAEVDVQPPAAAQKPDDKDCEAARSAKDAAAAMNREVSSQAAGLGISKRRNDDKPSSGGGVISDEVQCLARELQKEDGVDFLRKLILRQGWFRIRGLTESGLTEGDLKEVPREYRDLVRRYFLKIATEKR